MFWKSPPSQPESAENRRKRLKRMLMEMGIGSKAVNVRLKTIRVNHSKVDEVKQLLIYLGAENEYSVIPKPDYRT